MFDKKEKAEVTVSICYNLKIRSTNLQSRSPEKVVEENNKTEESQFQSFSSKDNKFFEN